MASLRTAFRDGPIDAEVTALVLDDADADEDEDLRRLLWRFEGEDEGSPALGADSEPIQLRGSLDLPLPRSPSGRRALRSPTAELPPVWLVRLLLLLLAPESATRVEAPPSASIAEPDYDPDLASGRISGSTALPRPVPALVTPTATPS